MREDKRQWLERVVGEDNAAQLIATAQAASKELEGQVTYKDQSAKAYAVADFARQVRIALSDRHPAAARLFDEQRLSRAEKALQEALADVERVRFEQGLDASPAGGYIRDALALNQQPTATPSRAKVRPGPAAPYIQDLLQGKTIHG